MRLEKYLLPEEYWEHLVGMAGYIDIPKENQPEIFLKDQLQITSYDASSDRR